MVLVFQKEKSAFNKLNKKKLLKQYSLSLPVKIYTFLKMRILPFGDFAEDLPESGLFVDVGTGFGHVANFISIESEKRRVIGIDIDNKRISLAKRTISGRNNIDFICGDIKQLRDINNIDVAMMVDVLHHIPFKNHRDLLKCIYDRLKSGGVFIIRETNKKHSIKYYIMNYLWDMVVYPFSEKNNYYSARQLKILLERIGFKITRVKRSNAWFIFEYIYYLCRK